MPTIGAQYKHYKGNLYTVLAIARHSEHEEYLVVYQDVLDTTKVWARPLSIWNESVDVSGIKTPRFTLQ